MTRRKKTHVCYIILKGKRNKRDVMSWCRKNKEMIDANSIHFKYVKMDKEYCVYVRPKSKFKKLSKSEKKGYKIFMGYLK